LAKTAWWWRIWERLAVKKRGLMKDGLRAQKKLETIQSPKSSYSPPLIIGAGLRDFSGNSNSPPRSPSLFQSQLFTKSFSTPDDNYYTRLRTELLEGQGYKVIRFKNEDVHNQLSEVLRRIKIASK